MTLATLLPTMLAFAWLLPLAAFVALWLGFSLPQMAGKEVSARAQRFAGWLATLAIGTSCALSVIALGVWLGAHPPAQGAHDHTPVSYSGIYYVFASFGELQLNIGYYIDALTIAMFAMVTLISTCVHIYSMGYMHDETHYVTDNEVATNLGNFLRRPGRYARFYQYLSLFSFSMLGLVLAGNLAMVFMFWELVGICSYFLIGFYFERNKASTAANKAFIMNRIGDFGMLVGLMALWSSLGTLDYADMFSLLRPESAEHHLSPGAMATPTANGYLLLFIAGIGIFSGCVGKSAQFPLQTWLPDAMEGPTPVSALVHSATMVAAGVFLVARCYPIFVPEALLVIAIVGVITLALAATIALTATDIKRVLAYSTISQLGYMMLALGVGGWVAALFHLITHAFFKSLLFLCSGSVIHAVHTGDMRQMGGLRHKMPWTAYTMLIGCLAIVGAGFPAWGIGLSGFFSKDAIIEQAWSFAKSNPTPSYQLLVWIPIAGALLTGCYMFRVWYMTFAGTPTDDNRYEHAHESPRSMIGVLLLLAVFAVGVGWKSPFAGFSVTSLLEQARPVGTLATTTGDWLPALTHPNEHLSHDPHIAMPASWAAFVAALAGVVLASMIYLWRWLHADEIAHSFAPIYRLFANAWWFDAIYNWLFVRPVLWISRIVAGIDRWAIDPVVNALAYGTAGFARVFDLLVDRRGLDESIDRMARGTWYFGNWMRQIQTGSLRQYVLMMVVGTLALFVVVSLCWKYALAG
jgi:proton-translocating NADH-quinone oxidoreductase chain L